MRRRRWSLRSFPNSGQLARDIFAVGIIGLGLLAIPVLAGSAAYPPAEAMNWPEVSRARSARRAASTA
jgi:hypothetical protein